MHRLIAVALAAAIATGLPASAKDDVGYLPPGTLDTSRILPAPPLPGSAREQADRAIFKATRALEGTPRWQLAISDADEPAILKSYACALGLQVEEKVAPALTRLLARARHDARLAVNEPKALYRRPRPFQIDDGAICTPAERDHLSTVFDYPSGHTSWGWVVGAILAELAPERATSILTRARSYGESRVVCGVHNASAVEAGRTNGAVIFTALQGSAEFRADMEAARREVAVLRAKTHNLPGCAAEGALAAVSPY